MNVRQMKQITGEWLTMNLSQYPGLVGAHFVGSINTMPDEADFPTYKDVDLHLVFKDGSPALENHGPFANLLETEYRGAILEGGYRPISEYQTPEIVLANPEIAHHLTVDSLIYDPEGWLRGLQGSVRREYARRKWVEARIDYERKGLEQWQRLRQYAKMMDSSGFSELNLLGYLSPARLAATKPQSALQKESLLHLVLSLLKGLLRIPPPLLQLHQRNNCL